MMTGKDGSGTHRVSPLVAIWDMCGRRGTDSKAKLAFPRNFAFFHCFSCPESPGLAGSRVLGLWAKKQIKLDLHSPYLVIAACVLWAAKKAGLPSQSHLFSYQPRALMNHRHFPSFGGLERGGKPGGPDMGSHVWHGSPFLPSHQLHQPPDFLFCCPTNPTSS